MGESKRKQLHAPKWQLHNNKQINRALAAYCQQHHPSDIHRLQANLTHGGRVPCAESSDHIMSLPARSPAPQRRKSIQLVERDMNRYDDENLTLPITKHEQKGRKRAGRLSEVQLLRRQAVSVHCIMLTTATPQVDLENEQQCIGGKSASGGRRLGELFSRGDSRLWCYCGLWHYGADDEH